MSCFVTILSLACDKDHEFALFINKDFIVSVRPEEGALVWLEKLAAEFAAMHGSPIVRKAIDLEPGSSWSGLDSNPQVLEVLQGDTQAFLKAEGFNELDYIDALETILMRSYLDMDSVA